MLRKLDHLTWQVLRAIKRSGSRPVIGKVLRLDMSRRTKDGTFLTKLVEEGFLAIAEDHDNPFEAKYKLTDLGLNAAEYGEYDKPLPNPIDRTKDESDKWMAERRSEAAKQAASSKTKKK
jgi:hypothetical protein